MSSIVLHPRVLFLILFLAGAIGLVCFGLWPRSELVVENASREKDLFTWRTQPGDNIWIVFINSVENLPVADHFVLNEECRIFFTETIYQAPFAGYLRESLAKNVAPGTTRISGYDRQIPEITFYAGYDYRHMVFFNGNWVDIYNQAQGGDLIRIRVRSISPLSTLFNKDADP